MLEYMLTGGLDIAGWDTRKAVNLLLAGNRALRERIRSLIVYAVNETFRNTLSGLASALPARSSGYHHYRSLLERQWTRNLADRGEVILKRYFYALRPAPP